VIDTGELFDAAMALPPDDRATLADKLLESLGEAERRETDEAWAAEAEARLEAYRQGLMRAIPAEGTFRVRPVDSRGARRADPAANSR
jgi:putative addiction module component (TIGR02574 family)